jgi:hypothetical protein
MRPQMAQIQLCVEGSPWPSQYAGRALEELDRVVEKRIQKRVLVWDQHDRARVGYGIVGYMRARDANLYVVPKCLHVSDVEQWALGVTGFLGLCQDLTSRDVVITGPGVFTANNIMLPWWADYYSRVLRLALDAMPFLRYEAYGGRLPYLRGRVDWPAQMSEWAHSGIRAACRFRRYQADNPLNRLLKWAAVRFSRIGTSIAMRARLGSCIEAFSNVPDVLPEHASVDRIRITASHRVYREPYQIARSLYNSLFPTLALGQIPSWGFVVDMVRAFEGFVDGLVRRAVRLGRMQGRNWKCLSQDQELLASSVTGNGGSYYTRPDNVAWVIEESGAKCGVVIDAKYKGLALDPTIYRRPIGSDFYQVVVACVSRGWNRALIIAPATEADEVSKELEWAVHMPGVARPVRVSIMKVDLRRLVTPGELRSNVERLVKYLDIALSARVATPDSICRDQTNVSDQ